MNDGGNPDTQLNGGHEADSLVKENIKCFFRSELEFHKCQWHEK